MPITVRIDGPDVFRAWQRDHPGIQLYEALHDMADFIRDAAVAQAPGRTKEAVDVDVERLGNRHIVIQVGLRREPKYAVFVHEGTGLFGPTHKPIFSAAHAMHFESGGHQVFTHVVKGQRPQPFLRDAIRLAESTYVPLRVRELGVEIS